MKGNGTMNNRKEIRSIQSGPRLPLPFFDAGADADTFADFTGVDRDSPNRLARSVLFMSSVTAKPNLAARCLRFSMSSGIEGAFRETGANVLEVVGLGGSGIGFARVEASSDSVKESFVNLKPEGFKITSVSVDEVFEGDGGRTGEEIERGFMGKVLAVVWSIRR